MRIAQYSCRSLFVIALLFAGTLAGQTPPPPPGLNIPQNMKPYFIGFLVKGDKWTPVRTDEDLKPLMQKHLAYLRAQVEAGKYLLDGPLLDDDRIRGIAVINAASAEEARRIMSGDPMVQTGRLAVEVHPGMLPDISAVHFDYKSLGK
jgi:uncharacterized protein YciI